MASLKRIFKKCSKSKSDTTLCIQKPATTPTFCKQNYSRMNHFWDMIFLSFCFTIGGQRFAYEGYYNKTSFKNNVCIGHRWHKRQLLGPKKCMGYYRFFSRKLVWFGIFLQHVPNIDIWGILPTQFPSLNTDLVSKLKNLYI